MDNRSSPLIEAKDIAKTVTGPSGDLTILQPTRLRIEAGQSLAIVGPSGSGKTTLLGLLAGLDLPTAGQVFYRGTELTALNEDQRAGLRAAHLGFVFQSFHLLTSLTALENVMLPLQLAEEADAASLAEQTLATVGLADRVHHYPNQLSGGEKQRVAIARAFAGNPPLLFADEPTGNLDSVTGEAISELLFDLNHRYRTTLVLVTHDEKLARRCDRLIRIDAGRVSETAAAA